MKRMGRFQSKLTKGYVFHPLLALLKRRAIGSLDLVSSIMPSELFKDLLIVLPELAET